MLKSFEKNFISYCENQNLEINKNQIAVIKKLEQYYKMLRYCCWMSQLLILIEIPNL